MSRYNDFWKPDEETKKALDLHKAIGKKAKKRTKNKAKNKQKKDRARKQKERIRADLLNRFGLHKYATNLAICYCIHKETSRPLPNNDRQINGMMREYWLSRNGNDFLRKKYQTNDEFYRSKKWKELRYIALEQSGGGCTLCGARASDGVQLHVDHIIPRSRRPDLEYSLDNLQVLCEDCNMGKSNYDDTDWRY